MSVGRPKKEVEEVYSETVNIAVRKKMKKRIEIIVKAKGISINQFARESFDANLEKIEKELVI